MAPPSLTAPLGSISGVDPAATIPYAGGFSEDFGRYDSVADLFRQISYDERLHKLESERHLSSPRCR